MSSVVDREDVASQEAVEVRRQLERLVQHESMRTSRRSVAFLRYIVEQKLEGHADDLKERTIGVNVFGKALTYDTNLDHVVRTAASELRKRLVHYYGQPEHRSEVQIVLVPGSYVPLFRTPVSEDMPAPKLEVSAADSIVPSAEPVPARPSASPLVAQPVWTRSLVAFCLLLVALGAVGAYWHWSRPAPTTQQIFWKPLVDSDGPVLIAVGDVPNGPPISKDSIARETEPSPNAAAPGPPRVPYADMVTIARITGILSSMGKDFVIRREGASSFADLRERPLVLVGAFNNEWSLRLTRGLRFTLARDVDRRMLYIRDKQRPNFRDWQWGIDPHPAEVDRSSSAPLKDYALISRVMDSETGHPVLIIGGLYAYGTQAAGEFLVSPEMQDLARNELLKKPTKRLQIVLEARVTDGAAGPPRIVAVYAE